jgi:uncharacterized BrkB/YihY/UPF0761 family membrane protein
MGFSEDTLYKYIALFLLLFAVLVIVVGIIKIHELPGNIAKKRKHPQADAIQVSSLLGLLILPLWFLAFIWAYTKPLNVSMKQASEEPEQEPENKPAPPELTEKE